MAEGMEPLEPYERTHRLVEAMLSGERPDAWPDLSPEDAEIVRVAGALNSAGMPNRPRPDFLRALAQQIEDAAEPAPRRLWSRLTRRGVLKGVAGAAGLLVAGGFAGRELVGHASIGAGWVPVARLADVPAGAATRFLAAGREGYLLNLDGALSAVSALCTHLPCVLQWSGGQRELICPCHQAEFAADGRHIPTPTYETPLAPLGTFPVRVAGDLVYVFAGESSDSQADDDSEYGQREGSSGQ